MNDLNEFMATEVMGWTLGKSVHHMYQPSTWFENNIVKMNCKYWNPSGTDDRSVGQAVGCLDKWMINTGGGFEMTSSAKNGNQIILYDKDSNELSAHGYNISVSGSNSTLPLTICESIKQAVKNG